MGCKCGCGILHTVWRWFFSHPLWTPAFAGGTLRVPDRRIWFREQVPESILIEIAHAGRGLHIKV